MLRPRGNWRTPWRKPWGYPLQDWTPAQLFAGGWQGFYADPISGLYLFSDTAGTTHAPLAGTVARLDATPGSPVAASFTNATVSQQPVRRADGLEFDGVDDYLSYPDDPALRFGTTDFTLAAAFRPDTISDRGGILSKRGTGGPGTNPGWGLRRVGDGVIFEYDFVGATTNPTSRFIATSVLAIGVWTDIIAERHYAGEALVAYIDNVAQTPISAEGADISGTRMLSIGAEPSLNYLMGGRIGRTFAIDRLLTPAERAKLNAWLKEPHS